MGHPAAALAAVGREPGEDKVAHVCEVGSGDSTTWSTT